MAFEAVENAVRKILIDNVNLAAEISTRAYPDVLPQNPTFPAITIQKVDGDPIDNIQGNYGLERAVFQIDVWSETSVERGEVSELLRQAIAGYTGTVLDVKIQGIRIESTFNRYEVEVKNYRKIHRVIVWHREINPTN